VIAAFSPTVGLAATLDGNDVVVWVGASGQAIRRLPSAAPAVALAFSPDGRALAAACTDGVVRVWPLSGEPSARDLPHGTGVNAVAFSRDGRRLATAASDGKARVWDLARPTDRPREFPHTGPVQAIAFGTDDTLATASDTTVRVWRANEAQPALQSTPDFVIDLSFSPDGARLASGSADGTATVWSLEDRAAAVRIKTPEAIKVVAFNADGSLLVTASADRVVRVWDSATSQERSRLQHLAPVQLVAFASDGRRLVTMGPDELGSWLFHERPWRAEDMIEAGCERIARNLTAEEWKQHLGPAAGTYRRTCPRLPEVE
jgi:WD40 repeat protein